MLSTQCNVLNGITFILVVCLKEELFQKNNHRASHEVLTVKMTMNNMLTIVGFNQNFAAKKSFFPQSLIKHHRVVNL